MNKGFDFEKAHQVHGISEDELKGDNKVLALYGDIIDTEWDGVRRHKRSNGPRRGAQFKPFAALTGFDDEIEAVRRIVDGE
ncbi:MAG: hypothetical protein VZR00_01270 [Lachnospiraceae bacterium]|jgi:hypothetical protein|nr:hypothetical protein [Lachnospiraceae bacterium]MEE3460506.1 hypothetical protein [Lachnospiraceae bacterium]